MAFFQRNFEWYGRDNQRLAVAPYDGMVQALIRARIPYLPVHADHIERDAGQFSVLVLPNLAAMMSTSQVEAVRSFVSRGGSLIATDETSLYDEYGDPRPDFALADVWRHLHGQAVGPKNPAGLQHSYLRLTPDVGQDVDGRATETSPHIRRPGTRCCGALKTPTFSTLAAYSRK